MAWQCKRISRWEGKKAGEVLQDVAMLQCPSTVWVLVSFSVAVQAHLLGLSSQAEINYLK